MTETVGDQIKIILEKIQKENQDNDLERLKQQRRAWRKDKKITNS